jgi:TPR repeat protein
VLPAVFSIPIGHDKLSDLGTMIRIATIALTAALVLFQPSGIALAQSSDQTVAKQKVIADLQEMAAAGDVKSQVQIGLAYLTGDGVHKDDVQALKWLRKAADQDNAIAERYLAEMYFKGRGVSADVAEAAKWLRLAAEQGDAQSQHNLAVLYLQGLGVPKNAKEAVNWMHKSAVQGLAAGQVGMGALFENGDGVPPDPVEAVKWYRMAVEQNDARAMSNLALLLATSKNPHVHNPQEAISLATKAVATSNNPDYLDTLAAAYFADGQTDKAIEAEQKALAMSPSNDSYKESLQKYLAANGGR